MSAHRHVLGLVLSAGLLMTAGSALADGHHDGFGGPSIGGPGFGPPGHGGPAPSGPSAPSGNGAAAPELAGHGAPAALALIAGGAAIVFSRRRRQS